MSDIKKQVRNSRYVSKYNLKKVKISNDFIYEMMKFDEVTEEEMRELKRRSDNFLLLSNYNKDFSGFKSLSDKLLGGNLIEELLLSTPPLSNVSAHNLSRGDINAGSLRFLTEEVYNRGVGHISLYDNQGNFNGLVSLYDSTENLEKDLYLRQKYYDVPDSDFTLSNVSETISNIGLTGMAISKSFSDNSKEETNFAIISMWKAGEKISLQKLINDDPRVKKLIESGKTGTNLYNWWEINLVKNVSKDKESYVNQIPREVLRRLILATTDKRNIVLDPMCGTGSTLLAARDEGRSGIGIDINSDLKKIWKKY